MTKLVNSFLIPCKMASYATITLNVAKFVSGDTGDSTHFCRLCFTSVEEENQIYCNGDIVKLQRPYFDEEIAFQDMFIELGVTVEPLLPDELCKNCATHTINSFLFQRLCEYSDMKWKEALTMLKEALPKSEIGKNVQTSYVMLNKENPSILTTKRIGKSKSSALAKIKSMHTVSPTKYATRQRKEKIINVICEECGEHCVSRRLLLKHMKLHKSVNSRVLCTQCPKYFTQTSHLKDHVERVHYPKILQCDKCAQMFSTDKLLKEHETQQHTAVICKLCSEELPSRRALRTHLDKHGVSKCDRCGKTFQHRQSFKRHSILCGKIKPSYICDLCSKCYPRKRALSNHMTTIHGFGKALSCSWCNKKCHSANYLRHHIVKHTRERNFCCDQCGGKFVTQAALKYHVRLHTGERPFPCDLCEEKFLSASRRMEHKRRKHFAPSYACSICNAKFTTGHQMRKHEQRHYNPNSKLYLPGASTIIKKDTTETDVGISGI